MQPLPVYTDFHGLAELRSATTGTPGDRLDNVARQFSAVFAHMMLKSMRLASLGEGMFDSQQSEFYRDLFDQQMALQLTQGEGLGIAKLLANQFSSLVDSEAPDQETLAQVGVYEDVKRWSDEPQVAVPSAVNVKNHDAPQRGNAE